MDHLTVTEFLERVQHMPDIEAEAELLARKDRSALEMAMLNHERANLMPKSKEHKAIGVELLTMGYDNHRVNQALTARRRKMERLTWARAVTALYGQEGYEACRKWMACMDPDRFRPKG